MYILYTFYVYTNVFEKYRIAGKKIRYNYYYLNNNNNKK